MSGLLVLLNKITEATTAGSGNIDKAATLEVVLLADVGALKGHGNPVKTEAARAAEQKAL